jgi:replicative DNA helicase
VSAPLATWLGSESPKAVEAERAVLGGLIVDPSWLSRLAVLLEPEDFYRPEHAAMFRLLLTMQATGKRIDLVLVAHAIRDDPERYGGAAYVAELPEHVVSTANLEHYAEAVTTTAEARKLVELGWHVAKEASMQERPASEVARDLSLELSRLATRSRRVKHTMSGPELTVELERHWAERELGRVAPALPTGIRELDAILGGGFEKGSLVTVAGCTGQGKTGFAMGLGVRWALDGRVVDYWSLEMPKQFSIFTRALSAATRLPAGLIRRGEFEDDYERQAVVEAGHKLDRLYLSDQPGARLANIVAEARRLWCAEGGLSALFVDYIGLVRGLPGDKSVRAQQLGAMTKELKQLALELGCVVVVLAQLKQAAEKREPAKGKGPTGPSWRSWHEHVALPTMGDVRDSGEIAEDSDVVLFPVNARRYGLTGADADYGAIVVAKLREGELGAVVPCLWDGPSTSYLDINTKTRAVPDLQVVPPYGGSDE